MERMAALLGNEFPAFAQSYTESGHTGLRLNTLKITPERFRQLAPFQINPLGEWDAAAFQLTSNETVTPGKHPYHWAGLYYLQEPSAMVVGALARPQPGEWVLDIAAAPGGKSTHLAALMQDTGLLVSNDVDRGRAHILAENLARWGTQNSLITNDTPEKLAQTWSDLFDRVLVDAPCSGEGMFRRQGGFAWSENMVQACARRQKSLITTAARCVRPGGFLVYATCTFAPEEDEQVIAHFLHQRPDFVLMEPPHYPGFAPGHPEWADNTSALHHATRLWPHQFPGEGHFVALLQRSGASIGFPGHAPKPKSKTALYKQTNQIPQEWRAFAAEHLHEAFPAHRFHLAGNRLYLLPEQPVATEAIRLVRYGLLLGEVGKGYFKPAPTLALTLSTKATPTYLDYPAAAAEIRAYLAGQEFAATGPDGWVLVAVDGFGLGWGKRVRGRVKNHSPHPRQEQKLPL